MTWRDNEPDVLIVVPTLGRRIGYLREALTSVVEQERRADIVVVTPPDAVEARAVATEVRATVINDPGGLSAAVNVGMAAAKPHHRFANWLGDDDVLPSGSLRSTADVLDRDPRASMAYGHCTYIDGEGRPLFVSRAGRLAPALLGWGPNLVPQPGMLFRLADFFAVGGLDESLRYSMDLDLLLRLKRHGRLVDSGSDVSMFRWHPESLTVSARRASLAEAELVKRRYLPRSALRFSSLWERPVRIATHAAAHRVAQLAARAAASQPSSMNQP